ncbi:endonuclease [Flavobacterium sp. N1946]|uniref:endonuclease n=1 Tax=Flavobacterium sp. N1946 TaxID=2986826 RepID=UPI002225A9EB|nr:endonuclease [Flavobacterium sp. N1946]
MNFSQTGNNLKNQLTTLITNTHTTELPYTSSTSTDTWDALKQTDLNPNNTQNVLLFYGWNDTDTEVNNDYSRNKDLSCHTSSCSGLWVREHVYPRSLGTPNLDFVGAGSDAHNLRSIDSDRNNARSNRIFEEGSGIQMSYQTLSGNWYPGNDWKGDVARIIMYMYVRYPSQCLASAVGAGSSSFSPFGDMPNVFLEWNAQDPVSQYERNRNNILQNLQGNRNPFIDNPYIATLIWNGPAATDTWGALSTNEINLVNVTLYPTITAEYVNIANPENKTYSYTIENIFGQTLTKNTTTDKIDLSLYNTGLYFITIQSDNRFKTIKVIRK